MFSSEQVLNLSQSEFDSILELGASVLSLFALLLVYEALSLDNNGLTPREKYFNRINFCRMKQKRVHSYNAKSTYYKKAYQM